MRADVSFGGADGGELRLVVTARLCRMASARPAPIDSITNLEAR